MSRTESLPRDRTPVEPGAALTDLLTVEHVAERCGISTKTVMRAIRSGDLIASQLAKRGGWVVEEANLADWIVRRRTRGAPQPAPTPAPTLARRPVPQTPRRASAISTNGTLTVTPTMGRKA